MVRCWTCGAIVSDLCYTCSLCESLTELKRFQNMVRTYGRGLSISDKFENMVKVQENCFRNLRETVAKEQLSELASAIEWSFETVNWELQLQTDALLNIDNTLKTSFEKHANEWRKNAEISSRSEEIDASEKVFLNALEVNPSDYRIYVGLGFIYLRRNKFYAAKTILRIV